MSNQKKLYLEMLEEGRRRYRRNLHKAREQGQESRTMYARRLMQMTLETYIEAIQGWIKSVSSTRAGARHACLPILETLDIPSTAAVAMATMIDLSASRTSYPHMIMRVAKSVFDEYRFSHFKAEAPVLWKKLQGQLEQCRDTRHRSIVLACTMRRSIEKNPKLHVPIWPIRLRGHLGTVLLEILKDSTGIITTTNTRATGSKKTKTLVCLSPEVMEWAEDFHVRAETLFPIWMPMVNQPEPWTTPFVGGYDKEFIEGGTLIKARGEEYVRKVIGEADLTEVYESLNLLQSTRWKVNTPVLDVIQHIRQQGHDDLDIPGIQDEPDPARPANIDTCTVARAEWKAKAAQTHLRNVSTRAKRLRINRCVQMAEKFRGAQSIYFPYQLDFRGRAYCSHSYLSPQGDDLSKALLLFATGKPVWNEDDVKWLAIHGANTFGVDKVPFDDRVQWVHDNEALIIRCAEDALSETFWHTADKPWQFLAWCYEWYRYTQKGYGFFTYLPVQIDGTNNGLQILSILARDEVGARETNCSDTPEPFDIYGAVARSVCRTMEEDKENLAAKFWLEFGVDRKTVKRSVMIVPYGGTFFSSEEYIKVWYKETLRKRKTAPLSLDLEFKYIRYLNKIAWAAVCDHTQCAQSVMDWMMKCAGILCKEKKKVKWTTPQGLPVQQDYFNQKKINIQTALGQKYKWTRVTIDDIDKTDNRRNTNAVSPNFVHSLDAAVLHETIRIGYKMNITDFSVVHDSFGTHCTNTTELAAALRFSVMRLFEPNLLAILHEEFQSQTDTVLPLPPELGNFNLDQVAAATYMFA